MKKIREMYDCAEGSLEYSENLAGWVSEVIEKETVELDEVDILRCISEDLFMESAVEAMIRILLKNPLAGDMYDGELLEMASDIDDYLMARHISSVRSIVDASDELLYEKRWDSDDDRTSFRNSAVNLRRLLDEETLMEILSETEDAVARNQVAIYLGSMQCDEAAESIVELIGSLEPSYSRGPLLYALQGLNITYDQLMSIIPYAAAGNLEERVSASNLLKANLCRLNEDELGKVSEMLERMTEK